MKISVNMASIVTVGQDHTEYLVAQSSRLFESFGRRAEFVLMKKLLFFRYANLGIVSPLYRLLSTGHEIITSLSFMSCDLPS